MSLGNDVVDLGDPESRLLGLHPRWAERVFAPPEREALEAARDAGESARHLLHWALWAAKESAYKARKRAAPATVCSPREFVVELAPLPRADGVADGRVVHRGEAYGLEVRIDGPCLHAIAAAPETLGSRILARAAVTRGDPGDCVRRLAVRAFASALGVAPGRLRVDGRPPVLLEDGRSAGACLSLSHHGRFVAFAGAAGANDSPGAMDRNAT